jgi:hypothetical protein
MAARSGCQQQPFSDSSTAAASWRKDAPTRTPAREFYADQRTKEHRRPDRLNGKINNSDTPQTENTQTRHGNQHIINENRNYGRPPHQNQSDNAEDHIDGQLRTSSRDPATTPGGRTATHPDKSEADEGRANKQAVKDDDARVEPLPDQKADLDSEKGTDNHGIPNHKPPDGLTLRLGH